MSRSEMTRDKYEFCRPEISGWTENQQVQGLEILPCEVEHDAPDTDEEVIVTKVAQLFGIQIVEPSIGWKLSLKPPISDVVSNVVNDIEKPPKETRTDQLDVLADTSPPKIVEKVKEMYYYDSEWLNSFRDGIDSQRIFQDIRHNLMVNNE